MEPDSLVAAFILSFLATAGIFYINIMAALVSGLIEGLHFSPADAGRIAAVNLYGAAVGAFCAVLIVRRVDWRRASVTLLCTLIGLDLASALVHTVALLTMLRLLHGLSGGLLVGISYAVFARTRSPDRCFGALMVVQSGLGGLGLMFLPRLVPLYGAYILFFCLALFSLVALVLLPFLPAYPIPTVAQAKAQLFAAKFSRTLLVALLAVFFFQLGNMALSAYIIELGRANDLEVKFMTTTIGISGWIATLGSVLVIALGTRWGRMLPIAAATLLAVLGNAAFHASANAFVYAAANVFTAITWFFGIPYLLGLCAAFDRTGRSAALAGLFSKLGLASGPLLASWLVIADPSYQSVVNMAVAALAVSAVCGVMAAYRADRITLSN